MEFFVDLRPSLVGLVFLLALSCDAHAFGSSSFHEPLPLLTAPTYCTFLTACSRQRYPSSVVYSREGCRNRVRDFIRFSPFSGRCSTGKRRATPGSNFVHGKTEESTDRHDGITCPESDTLPITIREVTFGGLRPVARLFVEEFFGLTLLFPAQYLAELHRLQSNYHSVDDQNRHLMLVATSTLDGSLAGFVDIDGRAMRIGQAGPPRPYLSDLLVSPQYRRQGVGKALVRACEAICISWGYDHVYLKVSAENIAAERLYKNLGYDVYRSRDEKDEITLFGTLGAPNTTGETDYCRKVHRRTVL